MNSAHAAPKPIAGRAATAARPAAPASDAPDWLATLSGPEAVAALADLLPDAAVFTVDAERRVRFWSRGAERLLGYRAAAVVGQPCAASNRCHNCLVGCGIADQARVEDVPLVLIAADGHQVAVRKTALAFRDAEGRFQGGIEVLRPDLAATRPGTVLPTDTVEFHGLIARDPKMLLAFDLVRRVAAANATVLVRGESGTGKEGIARALHAESARAAGPFVAVNCAALTPGLIESELFGHVRGAFTGAVRDHLGAFREAHGGTFFLDEIGELAPEAQAKLLRVLQDHAVQPVGGARPLPVDVRVVAATHRSLRALVAQGRFREDLLYRLRVVPVFLPPLRDRRLDLPLLLWHAIEARNARGGRVIRDVTTEAMRALYAWPWPGNVRELQNAVEFASAVGRGPLLQLYDLPPEIAGAADARQVPEAVTAPTEGAVGPLRQRQPMVAVAAEAERIRRALAEHGGHVGHAAAALGMSRPTFWRRRRLYGLDG